MKLILDCKYQSDIISLVIRPDENEQLQDGTANAVAAASSFFTSDFVWWKVFISNSGLLSNG